MSRIALTAVSGLLALGCGGDDGTQSSETIPAGEQPTFTIVKAPPAAQPRVPETANDFP